MSDVGALRLGGSSDAFNDGGCVDLRPCSRTSMTARLAVIVATVGVAAACSQPPAPAPAAPAPTASESGGHGGGHGATHVGTELWRVGSGPLGVVVTDGQGHYVYRSDRDRADPPTSTCTDACTETWHPL